MLPPRYTHSRKLQAFLIFLALILAGTAYSMNMALAAANIVVDTNTDNTTDDNLCTLREAITNANDDAQTYDDCTAGGGADTITFTSDYTITLTSLLPTITTEMTIDGSGHTITVDGDSTYRIFYVGGTGNLTINQTNIQNGRANGGDGGGVYNVGILTVTDSTFSGNSGALWSGGSIYNDGTLTMNNSTFSGNSASQGGSIRNGGTLTVTNSTFSGNSTDGAGGGIYNDGTLTVTNSTFSGNGAGEGSGIYNGGTLTVTNSTFSGNSTPGGAGEGSGIYSAEGTAHLAGNVFVAGDSSDNCFNDEYFSTLNDNGYNLSDDSTCTDGGTGSATNATLPLGVLADNGGATETHALLSSSDAINAIPYGTTISNNGVTWTCNAADPFTDQRGVARPQGSDCDSGAFESQAQPGPNFFVNTNADTDDGSCDLLGQGFGNQDCTLREAINAANANADASEITFAGNYTITLGSTLPDVTTGMTIDGVGHSVAVSGANTYRVFNVSAAGNLAINALTITNGSLGGINTGSGIYNSGTLTVANSTFSDNTDGGIYNDGTLTVTDSTFSNNIAEGGGGITNLGTLTVINSTFSGNGSFYSGGGIYNEIGKTATLINNTFSDNGAGESGGGVYNRGTVYLAGTIFADNTSGNNCYNNGGTLTDNGYNLSDDASCGFSGTSADNATLNLDDLADNGGPTETHALLSGSDAINAIPYDTIINTNGVTWTCNAADPFTDQRGVARPQGSDCDSGAFELEATQTGPDFVVNTDVDTDDGFCDLLAQGVGNQDCTLREAINAANFDADASIITFAADYTITLTAALPDITTDVTIDGNGAANTIVQASTCDPVTLPGGCTPADWRVFTFTSSASTLKEMTVRYGNCDSDNTCSGANPDFGGNIYAGTVLVSLALDAVHVQSGYAAGNGGGVAMKLDGNLLIDNSQISDNESGGHGGGVYFEDGLGGIIRNGSVIDHNKSAGNGGGIYAYGCSDYMDIEASTITNNLAEGANGGGLLTGCGTTISDSTFSGNTAEDSDGGGIYIEATTTITNSTITDNHAANNGGSDMYGGAIYNNGTLTVVNSTLQGNTAFDNGGGLYNALGKTATLINSTLSDNIAPSGDSLYNQGTLHLSNNIIANGTPGNTCKNEGGTIATDINNLIEGNNSCGTPISTADPMLGPLQVNGGSTQTMALLAGSPALDAGDNTVCANAPVNNLDQRGVTRPFGSQCDIGSYEHADGTQAGPTFVVNTDADTNDGFCDLPGQGIGNQDCTLREAINAANFDPAANTITFADDYTITLDGSQLPAITTEMTITGNGPTNTIVQASTCDPTDSGATCTHGYRVFEVGAAGNLTLENVTVQHGLCAGGCATDINDGGGIYNGGTLVVNNSLIIKNRSWTGGGIATTATGQSTLINASQVSYNQVESFAGGIYVYHPVTITNSAINDNEILTTAGDGGGGIYVEDVPFLLENSDVIGNTSLKYGGGIILYYGSGTIRNSRILSNTAAQEGGGIYIDSESANGFNISIENSEIAYNMTNTDGGGMIAFNAPEMMVTSSIFHHNEAQNNGGGIKVDNPTGVISGTIISDNTAQNGGGFYNDADLSSLIFENNTFENNAAIGGDGGAIYNDDPMTITNSTFYNNTTDGYGGGIYTIGPSGVCADEPTTTIANSTFSGNSAAIAGGGIHNQNGVTELLYNTITANSGGGVHSYNDAATCTKAGGNIIFGNPGYDVSAVTTTQRFDSYGYNLVGVAGPNVDFAQEFNQTGDLTGASYDPMLGPLADNGGSTETHALLAGSDAIDAGDSVLCAAAPVNNLDQRGMARPQGSGCDIGAYEAEFFSLTVALAGSGTGSVSGPGIACESDCTEAYVETTVVTLTASADTGSTFTGWSGACTNPTGDCVVTMDGAKSVTATFTLVPPVTYTLTTAVSGNGSISPDSGIYISGTVISLTAMPDAGWQFTGWSGDLSGTTNPQALTMGSNKTVTATFALIPSDSYTLTVALAGTGQGTVTSEPAGIACAPDCAAAFTAGTVVTLTAVPDPDSTFAGWQGACTGTGDCVVTMDEARAVTAVFNTTTTPTYRLFLPFITKP